MKPTQLVSVVLPTRNRARTLARAVRSVLAQSHEHLELLVVDDASEDDTQRVLDGIHDPRKRVLHNPERLGVSGARNRGIAEARGEWVAFQDSDDEWRIERLARQLTAIADDVVLVLCGDVVINDPGMSFLGMRSPEDIIDVTDQVVIRIPGAPCWLARRETILGVGGFDTALNCFEDWELALRMSMRGRVMMVNEPLVVRERTAGSLFSTERNFIPNLEAIIARHGDRLRAHSQAWSFYCNLLGQTLCQFDRCDESRRWFRAAIRSNPRTLRGWINLLASMLGTATFRRYVALARGVRARIAPPVRPALRTARPDAREQA